jgi:hypothetical protein
MKESAFTSTSHALLHSLSSASSARDIFALPTYFASAKRDMCLHERSRTNAFDPNPKWTKREWINYIGSADEPTHMTNGPEQSLHSAVMIFLSSDCNVQLQEGRLP